ncbi:C6 transcription factor [Purpureocillium lavendulum]|uniref:C6 transcription factor n=1 Tax=Purpureocillium lavendulum TaxID=1247861 RepID=A0AB34FX96_9HYPO|nr:C6 transcription factor [Purpureocillium lavendulum]
MPAATNSSFYLPVVDVSPFLRDPKSKEGKQVIDDVRAACISTGFFQMIGHGVPASLQSSVFKAAATFFALPKETKLALDARTNVGYRGYDAMATQLYEDDVLPDLKEGFFAGTDMPVDDPRVQAKRFFMGPNVWPPFDQLASRDFREPVEAYYRAMTQLCHSVLDLIAATLPYGPEIFDEFKANDPACPLRLLHYPPTPAQGDGSKRQLGSSAHTDFGAVTLLLQDDHAGLEVQDSGTGDWIGVPPRSDAYVVNMGDMISRITDGLYKSSVHRVINKNIDDRYSVVYFFDGNIDYKLRKLGSTTGGAGEKVLTVEEHMVERTMTTYNLSKK